MIARKHINTNPMEHIKVMPEHEKYRKDLTPEMLKQMSNICAEMREEHREMLKSLGEDNDLKATAIQKNILWTYNKMLTNSIEPLIPSLSDRQQEILDESGYNDLTTNTDNVINCAMHLVLGYIREATAYAQSCGGGSSPGTGWGRERMKMMNIGGGAALLNRLQ